MTGFVFLGAFSLFALIGWRSRASDMRFLARMSLLMAVLIAVELWWVL
ncbi:hypothetical protein [Streptomyces achromogenes]|nr:hypothetical protein [Streptomyces achromogenes]